MLYIRVFILGVSILLATAAPVKTGADPSGLVPGISVGSGSTKITPDSNAPVPDGQPGFYEKHRLMLNKMYDESRMGTTTLVEYQAKTDIVRSLLQATTQAKHEKKLNSITDFESMWAQLQIEAQRVLKNAMVKQQWTEKMQTLARVPPEDRLQALVGAIVSLREQPSKSEVVFKLQKLAQTYLDKDTSQTWDQRLEAANTKVNLAREHIKYLDPFIKKLAEQMKKPDTVEDVHARMGVLFGRLY